MQMKLTNVFAFCRPAHAQFKILKGGSSGSQMANFAQLQAELDASDAAASEQQVENDGGRSRKVREEVESDESEEAEEEEDDGTDPDRMV